MEEVGEIEDTSSNAGPAGTSGDRDVPDGVKRYNTTLIQDTEQALQQFSVGKKIAEKNMLTLKQS